MERCWRFKNRASRDSQRPVGSWTLAATMAWLCSWGSAARLVCWRNTATATPWVSTWWTPSVPRLVSAPWRSNQSRAAAVAASWAAATSARTNGSGERAHNTDTLLGAEKVASKARAERSPKPRPRRLQVSG
ncbi:MAG TPA: hypothetical protein VFO65_07245, partial [Acidimicrobiales bacterium]|nr:hypothetical protein [Acidimicrobiales bacterium]